MEKLGFGGGCHWCTEAVFNSVSIVEKVEQGWIASIGNNSDYSEAVIAHFDKSRISVDKLVQIHLMTHSCTSQHGMRNKYRSAVYIFDENQRIEVENAIQQNQLYFDNTIVTQILSFRCFKENSEQYQNYYQKNNGNQFCQRYIEPKLELIHTLNIE